MSKQSAAIEAITKFIFLESSKIKKVDLIFVFGSSYLTTMDEVKKLYNKKVANKILITGHSKGKLKEIEADRFYNKGLELGIVPEVFLLEKEATNTKENIINSRPLIERSIGFKNIKKIMFVCKAFHTRRVLMTAKKFFPSNIKYYFCPVIDERNIKKENWWQNKEAKTRVLEELRRIAEYTLKGDLSLE
ncbi:MAG: YdcF family protein [Candidatus Buchananbacteria bacterium]